MTWAAIHLMTFWLSWFKRLKASEITPDQPLYISGAVLDICT